MIQIEGINHLFSWCSRSYLHSIELVWLL